MKCVYCGERVDDLKSNDAWNHAHGFCMDDSGLTGDTIRSLKDNAKILHQFFGEKTDTFDQWFSPIEKYIERRLEDNGTG